ncbi:hypothetical protein ACOMHN_011492 [Nucella lapillus]
MGSHSRGGLWIQCSMSVHCSVTPTSDQPSGPVCSLSTAASRQHLTSLQAPCAVCPLQRHANICPLSLTADVTFRGHVIPKGPPSDDVTIRGDVTPKGTSV